MWPFGSTDGEADGEQRSDTAEDELEETVFVDVEREAGYTEHVGVATFADGSEREFVFDSMHRGESTIVLKNYTGYKPRPSTGIPDFSAEAYGFQSQAFVTIPYNQLRSFETVERRDESLTYATSEEVPESEAEQHD